MQLLLFNRDRLRPVLLDRAEDFCADIGRLMAKGAGRAVSPFGERAESEDKAVRAGLADGRQCDIAILKAGGDSTRQFFGVGFAADGQHVFVGHEVPFT